MAQTTEKRATIIIGWLTIPLSIVTFIAAVLDLFGIWQFPGFSERLAEVTLAIVALYWLYLGVFSVWLVKAGMQIARLEPIEQLVEETPERVVTLMQHVVPFREGVKGTEFEFLRKSRNLQQGAYLL